MTQRSTTYLKGRFETGDVPDGADYGDLIDSFVNIEASAEQVMSGKLSLPSVSAASATLGSATITAATITSANISGGSFDITRVSAVTVSADNVHIQNKLYNSYSEVSALGTTQGSAASVSLDVTRIFVTDAAERAITLDEHHAGRIQYIVAASANVTAATVFPPSGFNFLTTAENAGILLAANQTIQILHVNSSAYSYQRY